MWGNRTRTLLLAMLLLAAAAGCERNSPALPPADDADLRPVPEQRQDPFHRYDPPVEATTVRAIDQNINFAEGDTLEDNIWTRIFEDEYGIRIRNVWTVNALQYDQKLNISIAAGELPDFARVNKETMQLLHETGQLADLTEIIATQASPYLARLLQQDQGVSLRAATYDGKVWGLPSMMVNGGVSTSEMLWIRTDWLEKLELPEPRTIDDVIRIASAFAHDDPDGNGLDDTIGLGVNNELFMYHGSLKGFFNGFGAYPEIWLERDDGTLVYGSIQEEMRVALLKLSEMYAAGLLDAEFPLSPWTKVAEEIADGRLGMAYGTVSDGGVIQRESVRSDPDAAWRAYPIVSLSGEAVHPQLQDAASNFYVVRKDSPHPELVVKLANIYLRHYYEMDYRPDPNPFISGPHGIDPGKYPAVLVHPLDVNLQAFREVQEALRTGNGDELGFPSRVHYGRLKDYEAGNREMWFSTAVFGAAGSYAVIDQYDQAQLGRYDAYQGAATATMAEKLAALKRMQDDTFIQIIMGEKPIEEFDRFVSDWKRLGGDKITQEVNDRNVTT
ncbi:extracellular solute-binding protein [Paenibacillus sp. 1P07SE]|uniref:extracellular solute-binding protein n=1 Tax=Paenibacillus sp. 1P07SE TaxID=3132209 RepID=UPI0039A6B513